MFHNQQPLKSMSISLAPDPTPNTQHLTPIPNIIMFVEDPGAANYVACLPAALHALGLTTRLFTTGAATEYLLQRGIKSEPIVFSSSLIPHPSSLLLVGTSENPDSCGLQLIDEWRQAGGRSVGVVDAYGNAAHRFQGRTDNPLAHAPDWLIVPDIWTQQAYVVLGYDAARILICGHPHYDAVREGGEEIVQVGRENLRCKWFPNARPEQKVIVFVAEISTGLEPLQFQRSPLYTLRGTSGSNARTDIVIEELLLATAQITPPPYLVLRLHPKNTRDEFAAYEANFDLVSSGGVPLELIYAADLVTGMSSMLLLEAALLQRPTLSILPRELEMDWLPTTRTGLTPCATNRPTLQTLLPQLLLQSAAPDTDIKEVIPCGSTERVTRFLATLALQQ